MKQPESKNRHSPMGRIQLEFLQLGDSRVSDEGVKHIAKLSELRELYLHSTRITDVGLMELRHLKKLKQLMVGDTRTSNLWLVLLQDSLPDCLISY